MEYIILGHENPDVDSIISGYLLEKVMKKRGYDVSFVIPDDKISKDTEDICNEFNLFLGEFMRNDLDKNSKYILLDHNVREVPGEIVAIIDHHPCNKEYLYYLDRLYKALPLLHQLSHNNHREHIGSNHQFVVSYEI